MGASAKQETDKLSKHDQTIFRLNVFSRYDAWDRTLDLAWCHLTHRWYSRKDVKAAHLVPKALTEEEIAFLFWNKTVCSPGGIGFKTFRWKGLDQRELEFRTPNRPARRYLYFRFTVTYLHAKVSGNTALTQSVENSTTFWVFGGEYLHRPTLTSLARNILALELPQTLISDTFQDNSVSKSDANSIGTVLAADLQKATIKGIRSWGQQNEGAEDESEEEEEEEAEGGFSETDV